MNNQIDKTTATTDKPSAFDKGMAELRTLRDEVRLKLHLAGREAREQWETSIEPRFEKLEQQIRSATDNTLDTIRDGIDQARDAFRGFRDRLVGNDDGNAETPRT